MFIDRPTSGVFLVADPAISDSSMYDVGRLKKDDTNTISLWVLSKWRKKKRQCKQKQHFVF